MIKKLQKYKIFDFSNTWTSVFQFLLIIHIMSIPFKNAVYQISTVLIILFFLVYLIKFKKFKQLFDNFNQTKNLSITFFGIVIFMIVSNLLNPNFISDKAWNLTFMFVIRYALIFIILAYFYRLDFFNKNFIICFVTVSFLLLSLTSIYEIINDPNVIFNVKKGLAGSRGNRAAFGIMIGIGAAYCLCLYMKNKILSLSLFFYFSFFLIFSFARTAWVGILCAIIVFLIINFKKFSKKDKKIFLLLILLSVFCLVLLYFNIDSVNARFNSLLAGESTYRFKIWKYSFDMFLKQPILGYGVDSFGKLPNNIFYPNIALTSHNFILEILLSIGLIGLLFCILSIYLVCKELYINSIFLPVGIFIIVSFLFNAGSFSGKDFLSSLVLLVFLAFANKFKELK